MSRFAYGALVALLGLTVASRSAYGISMLMLSDGTTTVTITDTGGGDSNPNPGAITWVGALGVWSINVSTGFTKPAIGSATTPKMDLNTADMSSGAGTITIKFTDSGFGPIPTGSRFGGSIMGTTDGTVAASELYDAANGAFSGTTIASLGPFPGPAFSGSGLSSPVAGTAPFSLTEVVTITHTAGGMTMLNYATTTVPEPPAILLLGSGLAGFGYLRRRRLFRAVSRSSGDDTL